MKTLFKLLLIFVLLPFLTGCGTLTANSAVSARKIKQPEKGTLVYLRHSTKQDPDTLSEVNDIQDLRRAIKGDVEEANRGFFSNLVNLFKPTTRANRTFSEAFVASEKEVSDEALNNLTDKIFSIEAGESELVETSNRKQNVEWSTNRTDDVSSTESVKELLDKMEKSREEAINLLKKMGLDDDLPVVLPPFSNSGDDDADADTDENTDEDKDLLVIEGGDTTNLIKESTNDDGSVSGRGAVVLINASYTGLIKSVSIGGSSFNQSTDWERLPNGKREHWRNGSSASPFNNKEIVVELETGQVLTGTISSTQPNPFRGTFDLN